MEKNFFQTIYNDPYIKAKDYEEITNANVKIDISQGTILLEEGKAAKEFLHD